MLRNTKLYVNREEGFLGTGLKKDEYVADCSDIDDVIVFLRDGKMMITKVDEKKFIGKDIIHIAVFDKNDKRTIYNMIYRDGKNGSTFIKIKIGDKTTTIVGKYNTLEELKQKAIEFIISINHSATLPNCSGTP